VLQLVFRFRPAGFSSISLVLQVGNRAYLHKVQSSIPVTLSLSKGDEAHTTAQSLRQAQTDKVPKAKLKSLKDIGVIQLDENTELHNIPSTAMGLRLLRLCRCSSPANIAEQSAVGEEHQHRRKNIAEQDALVRNTNSGEKVLLVKNTNSGEKDIHLKSLLDAKRSTNG
jgi:hypothetical protein